MSKPRDDRGSTAPLIIGFVLVLLLVIAVAVDVGAVFIRRSSLQTLADGAALAAADQGSLGMELYATGVTDHPLLVTGPGATDAVASYLVTTDARGQFPGLVPSITVQGDRVTVTVRAPLHLPFGFPGLGRTQAVTATSTAFVLPDL